MRRWAADRGMLRTFTEASDWKSNGRCESEVGMIRRSVNTLMKTSGSKMEDWPLLARHAGERRGRQQLTSMGYEVAPLLPYNQRVVVHTKSWEDFQGHWRERKKEAWVRGPGVSMSLTSSGHYLIDKEGSFLRATDLIKSDKIDRLDPGGSDAILDPLPEVLEAGRPEPPRRRVTGKSAPLPLVASLAVSQDVLIDRLRRGHEFANEEARRVSTLAPDDWGSLEYLACLDRENENLEAKLKSLEVTATEQVNQEETFLQTRLYSLADVRKEPGPWIEAMKKEYQCLLDNKAIRVVTEAEAKVLMEQARQQKKKVERIPGKGVYSRKSPFGRHKVRVVACGNMMEDRSTESLYASGLDCVQLRTLLRMGSLRGWRAASLDIRTAFLLAPTSQEELICIDPPRVMKELGILPWDCCWIVQGALYGLTTAPRDWMLYRDDTLREMKIKHQDATLRLRQLGDANVWGIFDEGSSGPENLRGCLAVYVDDFLYVGEESVVESALRQVRLRWKTSDPEWVQEGTSLRFCGMEIEDLGGGRGFRLHQESYAKEVLARNEVTHGAKSIKMPDREPDGDVTPELVKEAQALCGELTWLSTRTRPDLAFGVARMSQWVTKAPTWALEVGREILKYLHSFPDLGLVYELLEVENQEEETQRRVPRTEFRSVTGMVVNYGGAPVHWTSQRQSLISLSTAEAELTALLEGLQAGRAIRALVGLLESETTLEIYNDNRAALLLANGQSGSWRTRHLRIRSAALSEALQSGEAVILHRDGTYLSADGLTKSLMGVLLERFRRLLKLRGGVLSEPVHVKSLRSSGIVDEVRDYLAKCVKLVVAGAALIPCVRAEELRTLENGEKIPDWLPSLLIVIAVILIVKLIKDYGLSFLRRMITGEMDLKVKILNENGRLPERESVGSAGFDISIAENVILAKGESKLVKTGIAVEVPRGTYGRLASRSSLAWKHGIEVGAGVVDQDYRGELMILLHNRSCQGIEFEVGDRVAQLVLEKIQTSGSRIVQDLSPTDRGGQGFGSTGLSQTRTFETRLLPERTGLRRLRMLRVVEEGQGDDSEWELVDGETRMARRRRAAVNAILGPRPAASKGDGKGGGSEFVSAN